MSGGNTMCLLNIVYLLIEKKVITQHEGAALFTKTANQVRDGSEDGAAPQYGEAVAQSFEKLAAWTLGHRTGT
jgi:hypothetical protein